MRRAPLPWPRELVRPGQGRPRQRHGPTRTPPGRGARPHATGPTPTKSANVLPNNGGRSAGARCPIDDAKPVVPLPDRADRAVHADQAERAVHGPGLHLPGPRRPPPGARPGPGAARSKYKAAGLYPPAQEVPGQEHDPRGPAPGAAVRPAATTSASPRLLRTLDEAAVLVGDEKTTKDAFDLMHKVKKLHPVCIDGDSAPDVALAQGRGAEPGHDDHQPVRARRGTLPPPARRDVLIGQDQRRPAQHQVYCNGAIHASRSPTSPAGPPSTPTMIMRFKGLLATKSPLVTAARRRRAARRGALEGQRDSARRDSSPTSTTTAIRAA